jgi:hypothetical protein
MLFDAVNEALNYIRPYGIKGEPLPWSNKPRLITPYTQINKIFVKVIRRVGQWSLLK